MNFQTRPALRTPSVRCASALLLLALAGLSTACSTGASLYVSPAASTPASNYAQGNKPSPEPKSANQGADASPEAAPFTARAAGTPRWVIDGAGAALSRPVPYAGDTRPVDDNLRPVNLGPTDDGLESLQRITTGSVGGDFDPAVSRDGSFLVFASTQHRATADLYMQRVGSSAVTQLTSDAGNDVMPSVSPDGQKVAFASDRNGAWNIYVMSARGGRAVQLTSERTADLHPTWSPDGSRLAFCRLGSRSGQWELWVLEVARPQTPEFIGYGLLPAWCPVPGTGDNGADRIAFQRGRERGDRAFSLWTIDYKPGDASSPTQVVAATDRAAINPAWSPDGQFIAYISSPLDPAQQHQSDLWIATADGSSNVNVTSGRYATLSPAWGARNRLFFVSDRAGGEAVWSADTTQALALARGEGAPFAGARSTRPATIPGRPGMMLPAEPAHAAAPTSPVTTPTPAPMPTPATDMAEAPAADGSTDVPAPESEVTTAPEADLPSSRP